MQEESLTIDLTSLVLDNNDLKDMYALLVVGRMGHGKSSFCKMLACNEQKDNIICRASFASVTSKCQLFRSSIADLYFGDIYVIDTPGLDSKQSVYLTVEQIDEIILSRRLNIIGIAYVIDIQQREQNSEGEAVIFTFLQILRMKYCYKINLSFCVLSKFDKYYEEEETNQSIFQELEGLFSNKGYLDTWKRRIRWISEPDKDLSKFNKRIRRDEQCWEIYKQQNHLLREIIRTIKQEKTFMNNEDYIKDRRDFERELRRSIISQYSSFQHSKKSFSFYFGVDLSKIDLKAMINKVVIGTKSFFFSLFSSEKIGFSRFVRYLCQRFTVTKSIPAGDSQERELHHKLETKLKNYFIVACAELAMVNGSNLEWEKIPYIESIKGYHNGKLLKTTETNEKLILTLGQGENKIAFTCNYPTSQSFKKFMEDISRKFYNIQ